MIMNIYTSQLIQRAFTSQPQKHAAAVAGLCRACLVNLESLPHPCNHSSRNFWQTALEVTASKHKKSFNPLVKKVVSFFSLRAKYSVQVLDYEQLICLLTQALQCPWLAPWNHPHTALPLTHWPRHPGCSQWGAVSPGLLIYWTNPSYVCVCVNIVTDIFSVI